MAIIQLNRLKTGQKGRIEYIDSASDIKRRLQDIGLIKGTLIQCVGKSPLGDPSAYIVKGAVFAIRSADGENIYISVREGEHHDKQSDD